MSVSSASGAIGRPGGPARVRSGQCCCSSRRAALAAGLLMLLFGVAAAATVGAQETEHDIKAAFLYKFLTYVDWPAAALAPDSPIVIGVMGSDVLASRLEGIARGRPVRGRSVIVRQIGDGEAEPSVHVLFIGARADTVLERQVAWAARRSVLLVTETQGALRRGAMINFVTEEGRVRFEVSVAAADRAGLKLGSGLLGVAREVKTE